MRKYRIRKFPARLIFLVLFIAIILFNIKSASNIRIFSLEVLSTPLKWLSGAKRFFTRPSYLAEENLSLKQNAAILSVSLARLDEIARENERLRALLALKKEMPYVTIAARVIGRDPVDWRSSILIDKGKKDGIKARMPCATAKGLIGSVTEVGETTSKVTLVTDPNSRIGVILKSTRESGVLAGSPDGQASVLYLSLDEKIKEGDEVLTAGYSEYFPKGLRVGTVTESGVDTTKLYRYATVRLYEDITKVEEIICMDVSEDVKQGKK